MLKRILAAVAVALIAAATAGPSTSAAAADIPGLRIGTIGYNAYGADVASNRNAEYVDVVNDGTAAVPVAGLLVQDSWARGNNRTSRCNTTMLAAGALPVAAGQPADMLPSGDTLRIYMGAGTAAVDGTLHKVFRDMPTRCGLNGHTLNNGAGANRWAPWDTVWVTLGGVSESKSYNFSRGYVAN
ncbi:hypothetical protein [Nonomuraea gerenzanensis]|uniref:LTD domain-containing protein n=1 Tax=Nonomuraea gerenzanensis TaxID=93944 RepID=A0A1M4BLB3_9ACTN|nr:hypothetical protein [Nonomuraea gerenzanensis]UBU10045.1 hypothetical protein LCN96_37590 [Nonomuraea gerenzanensis]SAP16331.1 hypothetical protein BN4615_P10994 [Nonomuraea gerenzanensis]